MLYVNLPVTPPNFGTFSNLSLFWRPFSITIGTTQFKSKLNHLTLIIDNSTNKIAKRKWCTVTFIFWPMGGAKNGLNARPSLYLLYDWREFRLLIGQICLDKFLFLNLVTGSNWPTG